MSQREVPKDLVLTEAQFHEVIERATRADAESGITVESVRQVAAEADIDQKKLEAALRSVLAAGTGDATAVTPPVERLSIGEWLGEILPRRGREAVFALIGGSLGWFSAHIGNTLNTGAMGFVDVPVGIGLILLCMANSVNRRVDGRVGRFITETAAVWLGFSLAWSITHGRVTSDLAVYLASSVGVAAIWGWLFVRRGGPGNPDSPVSDPTPVDAPTTTRDEEVGPWRSSNAVVGILARRPELGRH